MEQVNALLSQKPDGPYPAPEAGQTRRFSWQQLTGKSGKPYVKAKNEGSDFGTACEVVSAEKTDFTDGHGNQSFNVSFVPQDDAGAVGGGAEKGAAAAPATSESDRSDSINRAVAFKGAVRVVAYEVQNGNVKPEEVAGKVETLTTSLLAVLTGAAEGKVEERLDDGVPF